MNIDEIRHASPETVACWLHDRYANISIPGQAYTTCEDLTECSELLGRLGNEHSYLQSLFTFLDCDTRILKLDRAQKDAYAECLAKKKAIEDYLGTVDRLYEALSRKLTVYDLQVKELELTSSNDV
ncbi:hypothetical protein [Ruminococcus sp.]|uniref:hypothetical protein n=1 Tax=Ruminococcus sp. TaxID=41978 RepID=UPI0025F64DD7|nr:hypothetical protein [Ruminococcus sp.]